MITKTHIDAYKTLQLIHPKHHDGTPILPYTPKQQKFFSKLIKTLDQNLLLETKKPGSFVQQVSSKAQTQKSINHIVTRISQILSNHPNSNCVSMIMGTSPMLEMLFNNHLTPSRWPNGLLEGGSYLQRIHPIRVVRSLGAAVSKSKLVTPLHFSTNGLTILHDDIVDTGAALLITLLAIRKLRNTKAGDTDEGSQASFHKLAPSDLAGSMKRAWDTNVAGPALLNFVENANKNGKRFADSEMNPVYKLFAQLLYEESCIVSVPFYKNMPFHRALISQISLAPHSLWSQLQKQFLAPILLFNAGDWVMGGGTDTGFLWKKDILPHISKKQQKKHIKLFQNLTDSILRIGSTIPSIIALKEGRGNEFYQFVRRQINIHSNFLT